MLKKKKKGAIISVVSQFLKAGLEKARAVVEKVS